MLNTQSGLPVHMPANPEKFEFDGEVATIFPDMARRSIPLFYETHGIHAAMCQELFAQGRVRVADLGASRGAFIRALYDLYQPRDLDIYACDLSPAMVDALLSDFPLVDSHLLDLGSPTFLNDARTYDVVNISYVLQFLAPAMQRRVLAKVVEMVRPGGLLFIGAKVAVHGESGRALHEEYIRWRMRNGYSREEIDAKTRALANSMWPRTERCMTQDLKDFGIDDVVKTTGYTVFANYACRKGGMKDD